MAVSTTRARCVKVAQPRPYRPGSLVETLTTTRRMPAGAVRMVFTSVIFRGGNFCAAVSCNAANGAQPGRVGRPAAPALTVIHFNQCRLCMRGSPAVGGVHGHDHTRPDSGSPQKLATKDTKGPL